MNTDNREQRFAEIRRRYLQHLSLQLDQIFAGQQHLHQDRLSRQSMEAIRHQAHQISGSAGSFGFDEITHDARSLERYLRKLTPLEHPLSDEVLAIIDEMIEQLKTSTSAAQACI